MLSEYRYHDQGYLKTYGFLERDIFELGFESINNNKHL